MVVFAAGDTALFCRGVGFPGGMFRNRFRSFGSVRSGGGGSFQAERLGDGAGSVPPCKRMGYKSCLCCDVCRCWLALNFADAFLFSPSFDGELHGLHPPLCFAAAAVVCASSRVMRRVLLMACLYLVLCCAAVVCCLHFTLVLCGGDSYAWLAYRSVLRG